MLSFFEKQEFDQVEGRLTSYANVIHGLEFEVDIFDMDICGLNRILKSFERLRVCGPLVILKI